MAWRFLRSVGFLITILGILTISNLSSGGTSSSRSAAPPGTREPGTLVRRAQATPGSVLFLPVVDQAASRAWIQTKDQQIVDVSGNPVLLRGFVAITNNTDGTPVVFTASDFARMQGLGANMQSIRIGAGALGAWPGKTIDQAYLAQLEQMVSLAKAAGMYSEFKLELYDIGSDDPAGVNQTWDSFWALDTGAQDAVIAGWTVLWQRFIDEPYVVGYDLLNEPQQGTLGLDDTTFATTHLNPYYVNVIDLLRTMDERHLAIIQPPYRATSYQVSVNRSQLLYAPHFYPNLDDYLAGSFITTQYDSTMQTYLAEAAIQNAPLYIGEYSMPWKLSMDGNSQFEASFVVLEKTATDLLITNKLSFTRPWYADDGSAVLLDGEKYTWGIISGDAGLIGPYRTFITDIFTAAVKL